MTACIRSTFGWADRSMALKGGVSLVIGDLRASLIYASGCRCTEDKLRMILGGFVNTATYAIMQEHCPFDMLHLCATRIQRSCLYALMPSEINGPKTLGDEYFSFTTGDIKPWSWQQTAGKTQLKVQTCQGKQKSITRCNYQKLQSWTVLSKSCIMTWKACRAYFLFTAAENSSTNKV